MARKWVKWFKEISIDDVASVGGKNASLGEMYQSLTAQGVRIPNGFAITAAAYFYFLEFNSLTEKMKVLLKDLNTQDLGRLQEVGTRLRQMILSARIPPEMEKEILDSYHELGQGQGAARDVAVRSSATAEDLPQASFAGQQETYLNVQGDEGLLESCRKCFASLFTDRAISYRQDQGFSDLQVGLSIGVQEMVRSDLAASGVMFSIDTETGFPDVIVINSSYGLGENIVKGAVNPDEFHIFKTTLLTGARPILQKRLGSKEVKLVYDFDGGQEVKNIPVPLAERQRFSLSDEDLLTLSRWACHIEDHYSERAGHKVPMDMEWAKDGRSGELFIVQARPETVQSQKLKQKKHTLEIYHLKSRGRPLTEGRAVGDKIVRGKVRVIRDVNQLGQLNPGEILVTEKTDPDWEPVMKKAAAVVTNRGGRTCHAAIVSRELGLPAIVGTQNGTEILRDGQEITVSCAEGETGFVFEGALDFEMERVDLAGLGEPKTKIMLNIANPEEAFRLSFLPNSGVGLARMEFIIGNVIQIHPLALLNYANLKDPEVRADIAAKTLGYENKADFFIDKLAEGVGTIAAAFYPKDVIVRLSDFKTNEYAHLIGGKPYEPKEENPMLGFRGASRYSHPLYRDGFALECRAMKKVREEMGLTNVKVMVPFCRTPAEGRQVIAEMEKHGLKRGQQGLEIYVMCEIPSNVILAEDFAEIFDGFSIGSNDLTQLILGVDRDSEIVAPIFDERNAAVTKMISEVIRKARSKGKKIGLCGQAPSDYPEFARFLVKEGIDSMSLNADALIKTTLDVLKLEGELSAPLSR